MPRGRLHRKLLWPFIPLMLLVLFASLDDSYPPCKQYAIVTWHRDIPRPATYTALPPYDPKYGFTPLRGGWDYRGDYFCSCADDFPHWPNGDPGRGPQNPLPPQIRREYVYGVKQWIALAFLAALWGTWLFFYARFWSAHAFAGPGFDVLPPTARDGVVS